MALAGEGDPTYLSFAAARSYTGYSEAINLPWLSVGCEYGSRERPCRVGDRDVQGAREGPGEHRHTHTHTHTHRKIYTHIHVLHTERKGLNRPHTHKHHAHTHTRTHIHHTPQKGFAQSWNTRTHIDTCRYALCVTSRLAISTLPLPPRQPHGPFSIPLTRPPHTCVESKHKHKRNETW